MTVVLYPVVGEVVDYRQIRITLAKADYQPYRGDTRTLTLPRTVYGGEVDVGTGEGQETFKRIVITRGTYRYAVTKAGGILMPNAFDSLMPAGGVDGACSHAPIVHDFAKSGIVLGWDSRAIYWNYILRDLGLDSSSTEAFESWLDAQAAAGTPVTIAYKLAAPQPFTATGGGGALPALDGVNTVYTDADSLRVTGRADPQHMIGDMAARLAALEKFATNI